MAPIKSLAKATPPCIAIGEVSLCEIWRGNLPLNCEDPHMLNISSCKSKNRRASYQPTASAKSEPGRRGQGFYNTIVTSSAAKLFMMSSVAKLFMMSSAAALHALECQLCV